MPVRKLEITDHAEWLRMRKALWPESTDDTHALEMREYAEHPEKAQVFVYQRRKGKLAGFLEAIVRGRVNGSFCRHVAYIEGWFVDPDSRGRGVGRILFEAAEKWVAQKGLSEIASDCPLDDRESQAIHGAMGFEETFRLVHFLKKIGR